MDEKIIPAISSILFTLSFAAGLGGTMPLYCAEILPSVGVGIGCGLQWVAASIIGKFIPTALKQFGALTMLMFFIICNVISFFFIDFACPETKGLTDKDVDDAFAMKPGKLMIFVFLTFC